MYLVVKKNMCINLDFCRGTSAFFSLNFFFFFFIEVKNLKMSNSFMRLAQQKDSCSFLNILPSPERPFSVELAAFFGIFIEPLWVLLYSKFFWIAYSMLPWSKYAFWNFQVFASPFWFINCKWMDFSSGRYAVTSTLIPYLIVCLWLANLHC